MLRLYNKITFTSKATPTVVTTFDFVNQIDISTSYEDFTDTAKITIPKQINANGKPISVGEESIFKRGDSVKIELGYYPNLRTVFEGYITTVNAKSPIIIECEDEMYLLKNTKVLFPKKRTVVDRVTSKRGKVHLLKKPRVYSSTITLSQLLNEFQAVMLEEHDYDLVLDKQTEDISIVLGSFRATNVSITECLDVLKKQYGLYSYFVDKKLHVGLPSDASDTKTINLIFEENIIDDSNLEYQRSQDVRLRIKAISMKLDNTKTEIEIGDQDGTLRTFHTYNATESALQEFAKLKLNSLKYEGFKGDLTTFGEPYIRHGDAVKLVSKKYPDKDGKYQVVSVKRSFGMNGYKQTCDLGIKL